MATQEELKSLIQKRGCVKGKLTNFANFVAKIQALKTTGSEIKDSDKVQFQERLEKIKYLYDESFEPIQIEIEQFATNLSEQTIERNKFEDEFYKCIGEAKVLLHEIGPFIFDSNSQVSHRSGGSGGGDDANSTVASNNVSRSRGVKLPDIKLPVFNGLHETWLEFRDLFTSLIHENESINNIQKFHYLRASLEGSAAQVIKSLEFSANNYDTAWNLVCTRFENKKLLIHNHVEALFNLGKLDKNSANSGNFRKIIDTVSKHLRSLESLKLPTNHWDVLIIHMIAKSLDDFSVAKWEEFKFAIDTPSLQDMFEFLKNRADLLERIELNRAEKNQHSSQYSGNKSKTRSLLTSCTSDKNEASLKKCVICLGEHPVHLCQKFQSFSTSERNEHVKRLRLCSKCLRVGHFSKQCRLYGSCKTCHSKHHNTLLHTNESNIVAKNQSQKEHSVVKRDEPDLSTTFCSSAVNLGGNQTLLSTVIFNVIDKNQTAFPVRGILDSGSQSSYITESLCNKLKLEKQKINFMVAGINNAVSKLKYKCKLNLASRYNNFKTHLICLVIPEITGNLPVAPVSSKSFSIPNNVKLADENFDKPGPVDVLIGADLFWNLLGTRQYSLGLNNPVLQETQLGWVISGRVSDVTWDNRTFCNFTKIIEENVDVQTQLARFFEVEDVPTKGQWSKEETECESHFVKNTKRFSDGRFEVLIPFKKSVECLGESLDQAKRRFYSLERKFNKNKDFKKMYTEFLEDYKKLGQMREVELGNTGSNDVCYYLPHHGVYREESKSTKLRVVFDGSARTTSGVSLNDLQMKGPVIQDDLWAILLRFRQHAYVVTADIAKMYNQVRVAPEQCRLQRILWRDKPEQELSVYELGTVTFGLTSSPFLAIRCLFELSKECQNGKPEISEIIEHDFYVDDVLTGFPDKEVAKIRCIELANILASGGFHLRKWRSNTPEILKNLKSSAYADQSEELEFGDGDVTKTLGLVWFSTVDKLSFKINVGTNGEITKRSMLSCISRLFDPLSLVSPCVILAKVMLQRLWQGKIGWDDVVSFELQKSWTQFIEDLPYLNELKVQRQVVCLNPIRIELHAFSDASELAYGAAVYILSENCKGEKFSHLLCSKTKVAPIKPTTIPRLELCAAHILAKLVNKVCSSLRINFNRRVFWTDSKVILGWISTSANLLKPFVRNRIAEIQELTEVSAWNYVPTAENPADLLSRGVSPRKIADSMLWWHGPAWLVQSEEMWPKCDKTETNCDLSEFKSNCLISTACPLKFPFHRFSSLWRLKRCMAYVLRFKNNCLVEKKNRTFNNLSSLELENAMSVLVEISQSVSFPDEYIDFKEKRKVSNKSSILSLNPFMDDRGLIRVGGRLGNSDLPYSKKHPMLLSAKHHLSKLIFETEHKLLMHAGPQQLLYSVRENYWVTSARNLARAVVHKCIKCYRFRSKTIQPIMGNIPKDRFATGFPFQVCGMDYAGPIMILNRRGRGSKLMKCYICLFVCFSTKAIHLELVSNLSTEGFLLALRRFISRRGKPTHLYSDNGSNFVGANRELLELQEFFLQNEGVLNDTMNNEGIRWHFGPAYAPHFGGLWEAGVKATKFHLKRVLGNSHCTWEEMVTILCQIEAILNSRPLSPLSTDPLDPSPLTPAHFLVGRPVSTILSPDLTHLNENRLSRYQRLEQLRQLFWRRWYKEYISGLQQRTKWRTSNGELQVGTLVLIKDDKLPPLNWQLGRVIKLFPGKDNISRVCEIYTTNGTIRRDFSKICPLPVQDPTSDLCN